MLVHEFGQVLRDDFKIGKSDEESIQSDDSEEQVGMEDYIE